MRSAALTRVGRRWRPWVLALAGEAEQDGRRQTELGDRRIGDEHAAVLAREQDGMAGTGLVLAVIIGEIALRDGDRDDADEAALLRPLEPRRDHEDVLFRQPPDEAAGDVGICLVARLQRLEIVAVGEVELRVRRVARRRRPQMAGLVGDRDRRDLWQQGLQMGEMGMQAGDGVAILPVETAQLGVELVDHQLLGVEHLQRLLVQDAHGALDAADGGDLDVVPVLDRRQSEQEQRQQDRHGEQRDGRTGDARGPPLPLARHRAALHDEA